MTLNIHPAAAENFDKKASELVKHVKELPPEPYQSNEFPSELHVAGTITDDDIIGDIDVATADYHGNRIARFFYINEKRLGLDEESYKKVIQIAESIQSLPTVRSKISSEFIQDILFNWIKNKSQGIDIPDSFIEYLDNEAASKIETITSWIPIANLEVEAPFTISKSEIRPLSKSIFDAWENKVGSAAGENREIVLERFNERRKMFQGLAAVVTIIEAEPEHALKYTMEDALRITSILGIFSAGTVLPDVKCVSTIKGFESIAKLTTFFEDSNGNLNTHELLVDAASSKSWRLSQSVTMEIRRIALDRISLLLASDSLNGFENASLNYCLLYSKSAFTADPVEKVVHILSSLESILLKNESEPIQQNLAERVAIFTSQELEKRKSIIRTIKSAYGVRSGYLHHGNTSHELELVSELMTCARVFFIHLVKNIDRFSAKDDFVSAINDQKLS